MSYDLEIKRMAKFHMTSRTDANGIRSILPLLAKLGCRCIRYDRDSSADWFNDEHAQPEAEHEGLVVSTLLEVLRSNFECHNGVSWIDQVALLDGLVRNNRWLTCLQQIDDAHSFALLSIDCSQMIQNLKGHPMESTLISTLVPDVCSMLNMWISPVEPFTAYPVAGVIARHLFGDAWYYSVLDGDFDIKLKPIEVLSMRPPFVQGLVSYQHDAPLSLPSMVY